MSSNPTFYRIILSVHIQVSDVKFPILAEGLEVGCGSSQFPLQVKVI